MKELLVVIDYQNDFVNGALGFEGAQLDLTVNLSSIMIAIVEKIREYRRRGADVIFTRDTHRENYLETQEGRRLPVVHCIEGSHGHKIYGETAKQVQIGDMIIDKPSFGSMELAKAAMENNYEKIELVGLVSNICVLTNQSVLSTAALLKTALPEAEITVDAACTASFDPKANTEALDSMESIQINVINRKDD